MFIVIPPLLVIILIILIIALLIHGVINAVFQAQEEADNEAHKEVSKNLRAREEVDKLTKEEVEKLKPLLVPKDVIERNIDQTRRGKFPPIFFKLLPGRIGSPKKVLTYVISLLGISGCIWLIYKDALNPEPVFIILDRPDPSIAEQRYSFLGLRPLSKEEEEQVKIEQPWLKNPQYVSLPGCKENLAYPLGIPEESRTHYCYWAYRIPGPAMSPDAQLYFVRGARTRFTIKNQNFSATVQIRDIKLVIFIPASTFSNDQFNQFQYPWPPESGRHPLDSQKLENENPTFSVAIVRTVGGDLAGFVNWTNIRGNRLDYSAKFEQFSTSAPKLREQGVISLLSLKHDDFWSDQLSNLFTLEPGEIKEFDGKIWLQEPGVLNLGFLIEYEEVEAGEVPRWLWGLWDWLKLKGATIHPICNPVCQTKPTDGRHSISIFTNPSLEYQSASEFDIVYEVGSTDLADAFDKLDDNSRRIFVTLMPKTPVLVAGSAHIVSSPDVKDWKPYAQQLLIDALYPNVIIDPFFDMPIYLRSQYSIDNWFLNPIIIPGVLKPVLDGVTILSP